MIGTRHWSFGWVTFSTGAISANLSMRHVGAFRVNRDPPAAVATRITRTASAWYRFVLEPSATYGGDATLPRSPTSRFYPLLCDMAVTNRSFLCALWDYWRGISACSMTGQT